MWRKEDLQASPIKTAVWSAKEPSFLSKSLSPVLTFDLLFDNDVIDHILRETEKYAIEKGDHAFSITRDKFKLFLSILLISGYNPVLRRSMYWEQKEDVYNKAVSEAMSRNDFDQILKYVHLASNGNLERSKLAKVTPLINLLKKKIP
ncbi:PiggyBac transposable element-derived protein 3 [Elysia marginata]|uniref:PiggyBac transposable element-derived protein 3 n=1 Tax=Elysia marginata TaxID=1093978 RepID=A0AAV4I7C9_9GAST|nr:PiggyBac transposable element-derived protein 3 [Elysia marginata]